MYKNYIFLLLHYSLRILRFQSVTLFVPDAEFLLQYDLVVLRFQSVPFFVPNADFLFIAI